MIPQRVLRIFPNEGEDLAQDIRDKAIERTALPDDVRAEALELSLFVHKHAPHCKVCADIADATIQPVNCFFRLPKVG